MPGLVPVSRRELIRRLTTLGFEDTYSGGRHESMVRGERRLILPRSHRKDIGIDLAAWLLRQACVTRDEWEA